MKLLELELIPECWCLVPAPPGNRQNFLRGENLPTALAKIVSEKTGIPFAELLEKRFPSPPQRNLPRAERLRLSPKNFALKNPLPPGAYGVILVDDLCTTGATLSAMARSILDPYPGVLVSALVLARAQEV
jgi:predicted amidophosphoribosyltransferase